MPSVVVGLVIFIFVFAIIVIKSEKAYRKDQVKKAKIASDHDEAIRIEARQMDARAKKRAKKFAKKDLEKKITEGNV
jgi:Mg2+/citrate symporter